MYICVCVAGGSRLDVLHHKIISLNFSQVDYCNIYEERSKEIRMMHLDHH